MTMTDDEQHPADYITYKLRENGTIALCAVHGELPDLDMSTLETHGKHAPEWLRLHGGCEYVITEPLALPNGEITFAPIPTSEETEAFIERWRQHYLSLIQSAGIPPRALSDD